MGLWGWFAHNLKIWGKYLQFVQTNNGEETDSAQVSLVYFSALNRYRTLMNSMVFDIEVFDQGNTCDEVQSGCHMEKFRNSTEWFEQNIIAF